MADYLATDTDLTNIANAIRTKGGTSAQLTFPLGFVDAVSAIPTGGITPAGTKQITLTDNGTTTEDVTNYASAQITVAIPVYNGEIVTPAYNVTVALTNPASASDFRSCTIYEMLDIQSSDYLNHLGDVLGTVDSPTGSTTVSVDGVPGIAVHFESDGYIVMDYDGVCTGDVSLLENDYEHYQFFAVTGDGTVTIDRIDYAD